MEDGQGGAEGQQSCGKEWLRWMMAQQARWSEWGTKNGLLRHPEEDNRFEAEGSATSCNAPGEGGLLVRKSMRYATAFCAIRNLKKAHSQ